MASKWLYTIALHEKTPWVLVRYRYNYDKGILRANDVPRDVHFLSDLDFQNSVDQLGALTNDGWRKIAWEKSKEIFKPVIQFNLLTVEDMMKALSEAYPLWVHHIAAPYVRALLPWESLAESHESLFAIG